MLCWRPGTEQAGNRERACPPTKRQTRNRQRTLPLGGLRQAAKSYGQHIPKGRACRNPLRATIAIPPRLYSYRHSLYINPHYMATRLWRRRMASRGAGSIGRTLRVGLPADDRTARPLHRSTEAELAAGVQSTGGLDLWVLY